MIFSFETFVKQFRVIRGVLAFKVLEKNAYWSLLIGGQVLIVFFVIPVSPLLYCDTVMNLGEIFVKLYPQFSLSLFIRYDFMHKQNIFRQTIINKYIDESYLEIDRSIRLFEAENLHSDLHRTTMKFANGE